MHKICERCGNEFRPRDPKFNICQDCHFTPDKAVTGLLLQEYYDTTGAMICDKIYVEVPQKLAKIFHYDGLTETQVHSIYEKILRAKEISSYKGFTYAKPILSKLYPEIEEKLKREIKKDKKPVFPQSFAIFLKHHLNLALKNEKNLKGFCEHLYSVIAFLPKEKQKEEK